MTPLRPSKERPSDLGPGRAPKMRQSEIIGVVRKRNLFTTLLSSIYILGYLDTIAPGQSLLMVGIRSTLKWELKCTTAMRDNNERASIVLHFPRDFHTLSVWPQTLRSSRFFKVLLPFPKTNRSKQLLMRFSPLKEY